MGKASNCWVPNLWQALSHVLRIQKITFSIRSFWVIINNKMYIWTWTTVDIGLDHLTQTRSQRSEKSSQSCVICVWTVKIGLNIEVSTSHHNISTSIGDHLFSHTNPWSKKCSTLSSTGRCNAFGQASHCMVFSLLQWLFNSKHIIQACNPSGPYTNWFRDEQRKKINSYRVILKVCTDVTKKKLDLNPLYYRLLATTWNLLLKVKWRTVKPRDGVVQNIGERNTKAVLGIEKV